MPNTYEQWTKEQHNKLKQLTETPISKQSTHRKMDQRTTWKSQKAFGLLAPSEKELIQNDVNQQNG